MLGHVRAVCLDAVLLAVVPFVRAHAAVFPAAFLAEANRTLAVSTTRRRVAVAVDGPGRCRTPALSGPASRLRSTWPLQRGRKSEDLIHAIVKLQAITLTPRLREMGLCRRRRWEGSHCSNRGCENNTGCFHHLRRAVEERCEFGLEPPGR